MHHLVSNLKNSRLADIKHLNKVLSKTIKYFINISVSWWNFKIKISYADAAHGNLANGASQEGYLFFLVAENGKCILLNWQLKRIQRVVYRLLAAETLALSDNVDNGVYLTKVLSALLFNNTYCILIEVVTDSKSLYDILHSKKNVLEKCLRKDIALLKEFINNKSVTKIHYVPYQNQLANVLTKKEASKELLNALFKGVLPF